MSTPDALGAELKRRFRTRETEVDVGGITLHILHPADADALIDEAEFNEDERLPYWADIWPSSLILARHVRLLGGTGPRLLELGCGAGVVATAAVLAGFAVTATDYYADALDFTRTNVWRNTGRLVTTRIADWRTFPGDLGAFDIVAASDVLYEPRYAQLIAGAFRRTLAPHGVGYVTDPGRVGVAEFVGYCTASGLSARTVERIALPTDVATQTISIFEVRRA